MRLPFAPDGSVDVERVKTDPRHLLPITTRVAVALAGLTIVVALALAGAAISGQVEPAGSAPWWSYLPGLALASAVAWLAPNRWFARHGPQGVPLFPVGAGPVECWRRANSFAFLAVASVLAVGLTSGWLAQSPWPAIPAAVTAAVLQLTVCWPPRTWRKVQPAVGSGLTSPR